MIGFEGGVQLVRASLRLLAVVSCLGFFLLGCRIEQEASPTGPGMGGDQVIKFENLTSHGVVVKIPDAHHEFELEVGETKTVEVYSEEGATVFFVQIFQNYPGRDITLARRWTGFVPVGKIVTIQHISRVQVHD